MIEFHPQFLKREGKDQFVVLPAEEYSQLRQRLEDLEDTVALLEAKLENGDRPATPHDDVKRRLGI